MKVYYVTQVLIWARY